MAEVGHALLQITRLTAQGLHLVRGRRPCRIASKPTLASLHELLRPGAIQALGYAFAATQLGNQVITAQAFKHHAGLANRHTVYRGPAIRSQYTGDALKARPYDGGNHLVGEANPVDISFPTVRELRAELHPWIL